MSYDFWEDEISTRDYYESTYGKTSDYGVDDVDKNWNAYHGYKFFTNGFKYKDVRKLFSKYDAAQVNKIIHLAKGEINAIRSDNGYYMKDDEILSKIKINKNRFSSLLQEMELKGIIHKLYSPWSKEYDNHFYVVNPLYYSDTEYLNWIPYFSFGKQISPLVPKEVRDLMRCYQDDYFAYNNTEYWIKIEELSFLKNEN